MFFILYEFVLKLVDRIVYLQDTFWGLCRIWRSIYNFYTTI